MPTQREVIRFDTQPVKVRLDKGPYAGIECHGQYGIDWRYSVNNGRAVMYLPEEGRDALVQSGAEAGEDVAIRRLGKRRWEIERVEPDSSIGRPETLETNEMGEVATPVRSSARSVPDRLLSPPEPETPSSAEPFALPAPAVAAAKHMMSCYCVAVEVAVEVQEYARRKGMHIAFTGSDIRAMGITVYIGDNQRYREAS